MDVPFDELLPPPTTIDDTHKVYSIAIGCICMCIVASSTVLGRLYVRWKSRNFGLDDYAIIVALMFYIGWSTLVIYMNLNAGVGKPLWEISLEEYRTWNKGVVVTAFLYPAMSTAVRTSILLFYRRLFANPGQDLSFKIVIYGLLALQFAYLVVFSVVPVMVCHPLSAAFDPYTLVTGCNQWIYIIQTQALYSCSLGFDAILLLVPIWPIATMKGLPRKTRAGILVLFLFGFSASVAAAYKLGIYTYEMHDFYNIDPRWSQYQLSRLTPPEFASYGITFWIPSQVEPTLALICASLPGLRPALSKASDVINSNVSSFFSSRKKSQASSSVKSDSAPWNPGMAESKESQSGNSSPHSYLDDSHSEAMLYRQYLSLSDVHRGPDRIWDGPRRSGDLV